MNEQGMQVQINLTVVGATGLVGAKLLENLAAASLPIARLTLLAGNSAGQTIEFAGAQHTVQHLTGFDFSAEHLVVFCTDALVSKVYVPLAARSGAVVLDLSSRFRNDSAVPLVIPEINAEVLSKRPASSVIANPNCSTAQMLLPLAPLQSKFGLRWINVATYQSASGAGRELLQAVETNDATNALHANVIAQIDQMTDNGYTLEELKMRTETQKIFAQADLPVSASCVRVPVAVGHSEAISFCLNKEVQLTDIEEILNSTAGLIYSNSKIFTPKDCVGRPEVFVARLRQDLDQKNVWHMWVVADNLQKGAALNAVQIIEHLAHKCEWFADFCMKEEYV